MSLSKEINYKDLLSSNARDTLKKDVTDKMDTIDFKKQENESQLFDFLKTEGNPNITLGDVSIEDFKSSRTELRKDKYHFPDVIRLGDLINEKYIPSKIIGGEHYKTEIPLIVPIQNSGIGFLINQKYKDRISDLIEMIGIKVIGSLPDGLVKVTVIDKTGSGQNFPKLSLLHEKFIEGKVLSEDNEIERELEEIKHSMSAITQSISANGFGSIEEYNLNTDEVPQQYNLVFINGFPSGFNKKSTENLFSLVESGSKAGIYVFLSINYDPIYGYNQNINGMSLHNLLKMMTVFDFSERPHEYLSKGLIKENVDLIKSPLKNEEELRVLYNNTYKIRFYETNEHIIKEKIKILNDIIQNLDLKPVIDITKAIPSKDKFWSKSAGKGLNVPFGKKGIENVYLSLGINQYGEDETTHHGLIGGATGSGKTVFIHDLILMLSIYYSPKELQFYLLDYKEGTEFAVYKDFPYVKILSMDSEIEFGHEVLDSAISLMEKRGKLFKEVGAQNLVTYNSKVPEEQKIPRILIIIDEFQVLLPKDQKIASKTNDKLDRILRLGRSFGINLLLATQTLKGIDLEPAILSNIPLRVALRMDEKDAIKIFQEENTAPKFLKNPGEGIYNKSYGNSKQNVHFQAFRALGNTVDSIITMIKDHMTENLNPLYVEELENERFVYNGEAEGDISTNKILQENLEKNIPTSKIYLGEPAGLSKEHLFVEFNAEFGENMLMIGSDQKKAASTFTYMTKQILRLEKTSKVNFVNFSSRFQPDFDSALKNEIIDFKNNTFFNIANKESEDFLEALFKELQERKPLLDKGETFNNRKIYNFMFFIESGKIFSSSGFSDPNSKKLTELVKNGPEVGIFLILYASDFSAIMGNDLSRDISKFKKKIALKGGNSLKMFGTEAGIKFSKADQVAIIERGVIGEEFKKFKPYVSQIFSLKMED